MLPPRLSWCSGRLFNQIRSREGLAYSVSGGWNSAPIDHPGLFLATSETAQPGALLAALQAVLQDATSALPAQEELQRAKEVRYPCCAVLSCMVIAARRACAGVPAPKIMVRPTAVLIWCAVQESLNQFVFNFARPSSQLNRIISFDLLGIPQDLLFRWGGARGQACCCEIVRAAHVCRGVQVLRGVNAQRPAPAPVLAPQICGPQL